MTDVRDLLIERIARYRHAVSSAFTNACLTQGENVEPTPWEVLRPETQQGWRDEARNELTAVFCDPEIREAMRVGVAASIEFELVHRAGCLPDAADRALMDLFGPVKETE